MKVLVTGAAGFIGSHMAERLVGEGYQVVGLDNFSPYYDVELKRQNSFELGEQGIEVRNIDLAQPEEVSTLPTDFEFILHFAAQPGISGTTSFSDYVKNNITGTYNLLVFAQQNCFLKHFFNISTSSVYGLKATFPETMEAKPASFYGVTKLAAEQLVLSFSRNSKLKASSLRLFSVYGPRERPEKLYSSLISCAFEGKPFPLYEGSEDHRRSYTFVGDIIEGIFKALGKFPVLDGEIINLGCNEEYTTREGIALVQEILGVEIKIKKVPRRVGDQLLTFADIEKARRLLDYAPSTTFRKGLQKQIAWYRSKRFSPLNHL